MKIREGVVVSTGKISARVKFNDMDGLISHDLPIICSRTGKDKALVLPDVGELVVCLFKNGIDGYIIGSHYNDVDTPPPGASQDKTFHYTAKDGAVIEYDRETGALSAIGVRSATIDAIQNISITAPSILLTGAVMVSGPLTVKDATALNGGVAITGGGAVTGDLAVVGNIGATGQILDQGGNSNNHKH